MNDKIKVLQELLLKPKSIAVLMHPNPDGDTIGASLALSSVLRKMGNSVMTVSVDVLPYDLNWLPEVSSVFVYERKKKTIDEFLSTADLCFCVDFNTPKRLNALENSLRQSPAKHILIDHHLMPDVDFFDLLFSEVEMSSTSELMFILLKAMNLDKLLDTNSATCLFVGIMTDTGSFSYSCNAPETFEHAAQLIRYGLDVKKIHDLVYNDSPEDRLRLIGFSINEKLVVNRNSKFAYISLGQEDLKRFNERPGFTEGLANLALSIEGVELSALITQKNDHVKFSFRSKGNLDVNVLARKHFNGGGHKNASGGKLFCSMEEAIKIAEEAALDAQI